MTKRGIVLLAAVAVLAACGTTEADRKVDAYDACRTALDERLSHPTGGVDYASYEESTVTGDADTYEVAGYLDGTNVSGNPLRVDFTCTVRATSGGWHVDSIKGI